MYDLSVLSNIPLAVADLLSSSAPPQRLRPLFCIGVHDIPLLEEDLLASKALAASTPDSTAQPTRDEPGCGWIACTTDSILAMKSALYDVLITLPPPHSSAASEKSWPKVEFPQGIEMKATQRDLRRYKALRWGLSRHSPTSSPSTTRDEPTPRTPSSLSPQRDSPMLDLPDTDSIIEPISWSALAYSGFMWWASAGEQRLSPDEEEDSDSILLSGLALTPRTPSQSSVSLASRNGEAKQEMAIVAYFHRLTSQILTTLSDIVDNTDSEDEREALIDEDDGEDDGPSVFVSSNDVARMGLDVWSGSDHAFVEEVTRLYFGRKAHIEGRNVDVCGVRIC